MPSMWVGQATNQHQQALLNAYAQQAAQCATQTLSQQGIYSLCNFPSQTTATTSQGLWNAYASQTATSCTNSTLTSWVTCTNNTIPMYMYQQQLQEVLVDEEDWAVNQEKYMEWARDRAVAFRIRTAEQRRQEEERRQLAQQQAEERTRQAKLVQQKSLDLLLEHLTKEQREQFEKLKWFVVVGGKTKSRYRIHTHHVHGNIDVLRGKTDHVAHRLCCHCSYELPYHDHHLAQKIALEYDETRFLSIANRHAA